MTRRVVHLIESLGRGGAEAALVAGVPALRALGWDVTVAALEPPFDLAVDLIAQGVPVLTAGTLGRAGVLARVANARPHVLHTHLFRANVLGRILGWATHTPVVATLHDAGYSFERPGRFGLRRALDSMTSRLARSRFIAVSQGTCDDYRDQLGYVSTVIPNPILASWLAEGMTREQARQALDLDAAQPVVFSAGRLHREKGFDVLAAAALDLPEYLVAVAGGGAEQASLARTGALRLLGVLPRASVELWLAASDIAVVPSRQESFGIFAAEALAYGRAVVASNVPGLRETVGDAAVLFPSEDAKALASAIRRVTSDTELRAKLSARGKELARQFTPESWARRHAALYEELCVG